MNFQQMTDALPTLSGQVSVYYHPLAEGAEILSFHADAPLVAASVIKIPIMVEAFRRIESGALDPNAEVAILPEMKMPSCGALTYLHDGLKVTVMDLITLMIIVSDNTATNILIDLLGMESVNRLMADLGCRDTRLNRKLFDAEASARGIQNTVSAADTGLLLQKMYAGELVSPAASAQMLRILNNQRLNHKLPFFLDCPVAHKTGEDDGITHDVGIVYAPKPFVLCMLSNHVNVPDMERFIQDFARAAYAENC